MEVELVQLLLASQHGDALRDSIETSAAALSSSSSAPQAKKSRFARKPHQKPAGGEGEEEPASEKLLQEVVWRLYWKGWLEQHPNVWEHYLSVLQPTRDALTPAQRQRIQEIENGQSGCSIMDTFTNELISTGYMHNHARMWWAAWWAHVEHLPWSLGADFFHRHLKDGDAASNTLSWRWVVGLHTLKKTYLVRRSNLDRNLSPEFKRDRTGWEYLDDSNARPFPQPEAHASPDILRKISLPDAPSSFLDAIASSNSSSFVPKSHAGLPALRLSFQKKKKKKQVSSQKVW